MKCNICGKEFPDNTRRSFHAHCMREHPKEYAGKTIEDMTDDPVPPRAHEVRDKHGRYPKKKKETARIRPAGFRILNLHPDEVMARRAGFNYIDAEENIYTSQEAEENGWV